MKCSLASSESDLNPLLPAVLFSRWHNSRLFPHLALQPQLEISLVQPTRPNMDRCYPHHRIFHRSLDRSTIPFQQTLHPSPLDRAHLRHRPRRSAVGPNPLEHVQHGLLAPLGLQPPKWRFNGPRALALARRPGRYPTSRFRHDAPADSHESPCGFHRRCHPDPRYGSYDDCPSDLAPFLRWLCRSRFRVGGSGSGSGSDEFGLRPRKKFRSVQ